MKMKRSAAMTVLVGLAVLAAVMAVALFKDEPTPFPLMSRSSPPIDLPTLGGGRLSELGEPPLVVNFFASWCVPCVAEHRQLARLAELVPIIGIAYKDKPADLTAWLAEQGNLFTAIGLDADGLASLSWGIGGVPETFIVGKRGKLRYRHRGPIMPQDLEAVTAILAEIENE